MPGSHGNNYQPWNEVTWHTLAGGSDRISQFTQCLPTCQVVVALGFGKHCQSPGGVARR